MKYFYKSWYELLLLHTNYNIPILKYHSCPAKQLHKKLHSPTFIY